MKNPIMSVADAAFHTARSYPGGIASLAPRLGMSAQVLANKTNPKQELNHLTLDEAVLMQHVTDNPGILHAMAAELGYVVIPAGGFEGTSDTDLMACMAMLWERFGSVGRRVVESLEDGVLTEDEVDGVEETALHLIGGLHEFLARFRAMVG